MRVIDENHWWNERLDAWSSEGFNVDSFRSSLAAEPNSASELLLKFDSLITKNRLLRKRVIDSTMSREEKSGWLSQLDKVENTESILKKWNEDAAINRPWEPYIVKAEDRWSQQGRRSNLSALVKRLNSLDPSSFSACQPLLILFDDVSSEGLISSMLDEIESDEARRRQVVNEMIDLLGREGVDASDARSMKINEALDHLSSLQSRADGARNNRLRIEREIRPYDDELANRLLEKNSKDLTEEVDAIINNLSERLSSLTSTIEEWKHLGVKFPGDGKILPRDLLDWEAELPEIEAAVELHLRALERWREFATLWPDKCGDSSLVGRLDKTEEFVDLVDSLDQEWRELELEGMQIIGSWEDKGFAMDVWRTRMAEEPRNATAWLKREEVNYQAANTLIEALMALDASIDGEDEIMRRVAILREFDLDNDLIDEMNYFIETRARRGARHRSMLETDWMDLVRKGLAEDRPTASLTLAEFESLIADARTNKQHSGIPIERLEGRMVEEIEEWYQQGFSTDGLKEMLEKDPVNLALMMTTMREAVANHESLRRRVSSLDWTRAPIMSIEVNLDLSMPERLASLSARIPELMKELAQCKIEDPDFKFVAWRPRMRTRRVLVPAPESAEEDAMEAILKEMEAEVSETEEIDVEFEEEVEEETPEEIIVEDDETSEKKPGRIKGLVSGGGRDGVGKFGAVGDVLGGITDRIGVTDYGLAGKSAAKKKEKEEAEQQEVVAGDSSSMESILRSLGLDKDADMLLDNGDINSVRRALASHVGLEPRDTRLDRLLRLSLRLMPKGDDEDEQRYTLLSSLSELAKELSKWTRIRLEARHSGAVGSLLEDSLTLGEALIRIPGPGTALPLDADDYDLPAPDDIDSLSNEVKVLKRRVMLANSGGVR
ncbi:MAG: hypothetical protein ACPIB8_00425 [Candidatus Poseidoniaceae archaeon]